MRNIVNLYDANECTQCFACISVCPRNCITMVPAGAGFSRPEIDRSKCIECGMCVKSCHQKAYSPYLRKAIPQKVYASWSKDNKIRQYSSSGGAFSVFASSILKREGIVFGASFVEGLRLRHIAVTDVLDLKKLRGSKYLLSDLYGCYEEVRKNLQLGKYVLFTGTPCQIAGLYAFLKKDYTKLYTCDVICHGVPSQAAFDLYCERINLSLFNCIDFEFKYLKGWGFQLSYNDISIPISDCYYMNAFSKGYMFMESCYECPYAKLERISDITMADFWRIGTKQLFKHSKYKGVSMLLINTQKGRELINDCFDELFGEERSVEEAISGNFNLTHSSIRPEERNSYFSDSLVLSKQELVNKYSLQPSIRDYLRPIKRKIQSLL